MKAHAIIGAGYGDEGKGLMVDYVCSRAADRSFVVRYSGGGQSGHTVQLPGSGHRHSFGSVGAGYAAGAPTYLSRHYVVNPFAMTSEIESLSKGESPFAAEVAIGRPEMPEIIVSGQAMLTTHYDVLVNQKIEELRRSVGMEHGSCLIGLGETVERCANSPWYGTRFGDVMQMSTDELLVKLEQARRHAVGRFWMLVANVRMADKLTKKESDALNSVKDPLEGVDWDAVDRDYVELVQQKLNGKVTWGDLEDMRYAASFDDTGTEKVVFEGSQGLLLDERFGQMPHVTRARVGLRNIVEVCSMLKVEELEITYVTRTYSTRHGAGPMPTHDPLMVFDDKANQPNLGQGSMRFGTLPVNLIVDAIGRDLAESSQALSGFTKKLDVNLAVTWTDAYDDKDAHDLARIVGIPVRYRANGPTRMNVIRYDGEGHKS